MTLPALKSSTTLSRLLGARFHLRQVLREVLARPSYSNRRTAPGKGLESRSRYLAVLQWRCARSRGLPASGCVAVPPMLLWLMKLARLWGMYHSLAGPGIVPMANGVCRVQPSLGLNLKLLHGTVVVLMTRNLMLCSILSMLSTVGPMLWPCKNYGVGSCHRYPCVYHSI